MKPKTPTRTIKRPVTRRYKPKKVTYNQVRAAAIARQKARAYARMKRSTRRDMYTDSRTPSKKTPKKTPPRNKRYRARRGQYTKRRVIFN